VLRIRIRDEFVPDPGSRGYRYVFRGEIFLNYLKNSFSFICLLIRLALETMRSKKRVVFIFHPYFYVPIEGYGIRDENFWDPE
jgi:hypothetical protein